MIKNETVLGGPLTPLLSILVYGPQRLVTPRRVRLHKTLSWRECTHIKAFHEPWYSAIWSAIRSE